MSKILEIAVEPDHIDSLTRANGITALSELIWNSLDADASEIYITGLKNRLGSYEKIIVSDNGHGLAFDRATEVFGRLGGSDKKNKTRSPQGRLLHGKEGRGRYKSLALGDLVTFHSIFTKDRKHHEFYVTIERGNLTRTEVSDLKQITKITNTGFEVVIQNINERNANQAFELESLLEIEERFASYWTSHPGFKININGKVVNFTKLIKNSVEKTDSLTIDGVSIPYKLKVIEWNFENKRKTYLCNIEGIPIREIPIGIRTSLPMSIFIQSAYIEELEKDNSIDLGDLDDKLSAILKEAKAFGREYTRSRLHENSKEFIDELKAKNIYPYMDPPENLLDISKRQIFDIIALEVHENLPTFDEQDDKNKQLTLTLIKEGLERDSSTLRKILSEVLDLSPQKRDDLMDLLDSTSLSNIIDAMTEIKNRLTFLNGLEQIIYDKELNRHFRERRHLHKIIVNETWIFGDEYALGVDDISLKNVLKEYLKALGREDFEEAVESGDNTNLNLIPDVCLWNQYSMGSAGRKNLVIELKKPSLDAGFDEKNQIERYATRVAQDPRFPKEKTRWLFLLITKDVHPDLELQLHQKDRKYGHILNGDNFDVFILKWGDIITEAKIRHEFIKEKLNINLTNNEEGLEYLRSKYKDYLPDTPTLFNSAHDAIIN